MLCKCGCGIKLKKYRGKFPFFKKGHGNKIYQFNRSVFSKIKDEQSAYWLGFFYADGFVKNKGTFGFDLSIKDLHHLEKFNKFIQSTNPIITKSKFCRLEISDMDYTQNILLQYGLKQGKSSGICFPEEAVSREECQHFIRGFFDGDGWIGTDKNKQNYFGIVGSKALLNDIQIILIEEANVPYNKLITDLRHESKTTVTLHYGGNKSCAKLYDFLYDDATVFLERKKVKWLSDYKI